MSSQDLLLLPPPAPPPLASRRLPPPCWSHEETLALIDSYRDKWYSLRRGNLKATHWQDVADAVRHRCPFAAPPKTSVQCRHKMEKLRKRYRTEVQRALIIPKHHNLYPSPWTYFKKMDSMEKGDTNSNDDDVDDDEFDENDVEDDDEIKDGIVNTRSLYGLMDNGIGGGNLSGSGFRIRIPNKKSLPPTDSGFRAKSYCKIDQNPNPNPNFSARSGGNLSFGARVGKRSGRRREDDPMAELVAAIKVLGDGFVKIEETKMEMAREIEKMRMDMEMKRTEMILESQQRIVDAFVKGLSEKKKGKRMASWED